MDNFSYQNPTKIIFGKNAEAQVGDEVTKYSNKILLHYGGGSIKRTGLYDKVRVSLREAGVEFIELAGVQPNPRLNLVHEGIKICRENRINFILAVGGGSVIDSAKAIGLGVPYNGDVWDFFDQKAEPKETLPVGTILTLPASGSEWSLSCVITNENGWYKKGLNHEILYPTFSILNPELAYTIPLYQIACGGTDIMAHLMERYFTTTRHVELMDGLIESSLKVMINNLPKILKESNNYDAWAEVMWTGAVAHNGFLNTGRVGDWASHKIEHELSAIYDVAHGAGLAVVFPAWMEYVYKNDIKRFAQFASKVWDVDDSFCSTEVRALEGIKRLKNFFQSIGMPVSLKELGIHDDRFEEMADKCTNSGITVGNLVKLSNADVLNILRLAQ